MKWYYTIRGDVTQHGLVDEQELLEMARTGRLRRTDLVWNQTSGTRWVPAYTVSGLFAPAEPPPLLVQPSTAAQTEPPPSPRRRISAGAAWVIVVALLIVLAVVLALMV